MLYLLQDLIHNHFLYIETLLYIPKSHSKPRKVYEDNGRCLHAGTVRGSAAGFKLDALLRLGDMKAADRRTSLLQFLLQQVLPGTPSVASLPDQLATMLKAANVQVRGPQRSL